MGSLREKRAEVDHMWLEADHIWKWANHMWEVTQDSQKGTEDGQEGESGVRKLIVIGKHTLCSRY